MSVDRTIEELSGTLKQLGILVEHINAQIVGISARVNVTLDNFDHAVEGIAKDAGLMTDQVGDTVSQIPSSWVFYVLLFSLIVVLALLSALILINLIARIFAIVRSSRQEEANYMDGETRQPLTRYSIMQLRDTNGFVADSCNVAQMCAFPIEKEPKRYGISSLAKTHEYSTHRMPESSTIDNKSATYGMSPNEGFISPSGTTNPTLTKRNKYLVQQQHNQQQQAIYSRYMPQQHQSQDRYTQNRYMLSSPLRIPNLPHSNTTSQQSISSVVYPTQVVVNSRAEEV